VAIRQKWLAVKFISVARNAVVADAGVRPTCDAIAKDTDGTPITALQPWPKTWSKL